MFKMFGKILNSTVLFATVSLGFAAQSSPVLTETQYGKVRFGQPLSSVEESVGEKSIADDNFEEACGYVRFESYPDISFMVEDGVLTRGQTDSPNIATAYSVSVGATRADVNDQIPGVIETPHAYVDEGHYLTATTPDEKNAIVYEEMDGIVGYIRAGVEPSVGYIEGCL